MKEFLGLSSAQKADPLVTAVILVAVIVALMGASALSLSFPASLGLCALTGVIAGGLAGVLRRR